MGGGRWLRNILTTYKTMAEIRVGENVHLFDIFIKVEAMTFRKYHRARDLILI